MTPATKFSTRTAGVSTMAFVGKAVRLTAVAVILSSAVASAQIVRPVAPLVTPSTTGSPIVPAGQALISGRAIDMNAHPLPNVTVRLRNLDTNQIEQTIEAGPEGEFSFVIRSEVPYVAEIADGAGRALAVSEVVVAKAGDVAGALIQIPGRLPANAGMFADTASSVIAAATGLGVTVVPALPVVSPER